MRVVRERSKQKGQKNIVHAYKRDALDVVFKGIYEVCNKGTQIILLEAFVELLFQRFEENTKIP